MLDKESGNSEKLQALRFFFKYGKYSRRKFYWKSIFKIVLLKYGNRFFPERIRLRNGS